MTTYPKSQVNITVDSRIYIGLQKLARAAGMTTTSYAAQLFNAAYTARHKPTGDKALDEAVAQVSKAVTAAPADASSAKTIAQLQAQVADLRAKLAAMAKLPVTRQAAPDPSDELLRAKLRDLSAQIAEAAGQKRQLDTARDEIRRLRAELEARPAPNAIPDTALGRFLDTWNAELRIAA